MPHRRLTWFVRCAIVALAIVALSLPAQAPAPPPVHAHHAPRHEPDGRLQVLINSAYIYDEREFVGDGEIEIFVTFQRCQGLLELLECEGAEELAAKVIRFSAGKGDTVTLNRVFPADGDEFPRGSGAGPSSGIPVFNESLHLLRIWAWERDGVSLNEMMGQVDIIVSAENNWAIGQHKQRAWGDYYDNNTRRHQGDFSVDFEVRPMPLPDLVASRFSFIDDDRQLLCLQVTNVGQEASGPFPVVVRIANITPPNGLFEMPGLDVGESRERCSQYPGIPPGNHPASFTIDEPHVVPEMNELNNAYLSRFEFGVQPVATPTPTGPRQADLWARGLQVKSSEPSLGDGCYAGRNDITVIVKNDGTADAANFVVRLNVDNKSDDPEERTIAILEAGKELNVTFEDIRLRRGMRHLEGIADAKKTVIESDENNNDIELTVNCRED